MAIRSHHKNISIARRNVRLKHVANAPTRGIDGVQHNVYAMARQMLGEFWAGALGIDELLIGDRYDACTLRLFQDRKRVCDRSGRGPAEIPSHDHRIKSEGAGAFPRLRHDERGTSGPEYDRLNGPMSDIDIFAV